MADANIQEPPRTVNVSMFDDETRSALQSAFDAKGSATTADPPPTATADQSGTDTPPPTPAKPPPVSTPAKPTLPDKPVPGQPAKAAPDKDTFVAGKMKAADWDRLKGERDRLRQEVAQLKSGPLQFDAKTLADLRKERDELSTRLRAVAIERDPQFEREFTSATKPVVDAAKAVVGSGNGAAVERLLEMGPSEARDAAVEKLMEGLPPYKQTQLAYALARMDEARNMKAQRIADSVANWDKLQADHRSAQAARETEFKGKFEQTLAQWTSPETGLPVFQHREGDTEWNGKVDEAVQLARDIFGGELDMDGTMRAALWAAAAPLLLQSMSGLQQQNETLQAEIRKLRGLEPGADGQGGGVATEGDGDDVPAELHGNVGAAIAHIVSKQGVQFR